MTKFETNKAFIRDRIVPLATEELSTLGFKRSKDFFIRKVEDFFVTICLLTGNPRLKDKIEFEMKICYPVINYGLPSIKLKHPAWYPGVDIRNTVSGTEPFEMKYYLFYYLNREDSPTRYDSHNLDSVYNIIKEDIPRYIQPLNDKISDGKSAYSLACEQPLNFRNISFKWAVLEFFYGNKKEAIRILSQLRKNIDDSNQEIMASAQKESTLRGESEGIKFIEAKRQMISENLIKSKRQLMALCNDFGISGILDQWDDIEVSE